MDDKDPMAEDASLNEDIVEAIASAAQPVAPPVHLKQRIIDRVRSASVSPILTREREGWHELAPGIEYKYLFEDFRARTKSFLLRASAGVCMPGHAHHGSEECLVLEGEFSIGDITLRAGDFHCVGAGVHHDEAHTDMGVLVYLRADINDYPMIQP